MKASRQRTRRVSTVSFVALCSTLLTITCCICLGTLSGRSFAMPLLLWGLTLGLFAFWYNLGYRLRLAWPGWNLGGTALVALAVSMRVPATSPQSPGKPPRTAGSGVTAAASSTPAASHQSEVQSLAQAYGHTEAQSAAELSPEPDHRFRGPGLSGSPPESTESLILLDLNAADNSLTKSARLWDQLRGVQAEAWLRPENRDREEGCADRLVAVLIPEGASEEDLRSVLRELAYSKLWVERLQVPTLNEELLSLLLELKNLSDLDVTGPHQLTDAALIRLCQDDAKRRHMRTLRLRGLRGNERILGDATILALSDLRKLKVLELHSSGVTGKGLQWIAEHCAELQSLDLSQCAIDDTMVPHRWSSDQLQYLNLSGCVLQGEGVVRVSQSLRNLETIDLSWNGLGTDHILSLRKLNRLKKCILQGVRGSSEQLVRELITDLVQLELLDLRDTGGLDAEAIARLSEFAQNQGVELLLGPMPTRATDTNSVASSSGQ